MHHSLPPSPPRVGMRVGKTLQPALPVMLGGQQATFIVDPAPRPRETTRLRLDWDDGRVTELDARVREVDGASHTAHLDICKVEGDWKPFLAYLAHGGC